MTWTTVPSLAAVVLLGACADSGAADAGADLGAIDAGHDLGAIDAGRDLGVLDMTTSAAADTGVAEATDLGPPVDGPWLDYPDAGAVPRVPCGDDGGPWTTSPCLHWVECIDDDAWSAAYDGGYCGADGYCAFPYEPELRRCTMTCMTGPYGMCALPVSTLALAPPTGHHVGTS